MKSKYAFYTFDLGRMQDTVNIRCNYCDKCYTTIMTGYTLAKMVCGSSLATRATAISRSMAILLGTSYIGADSIVTRTLEGFEVKLKADKIDFERWTPQAIEVTSEAAYC